MLDGRMGMCTIRNKDGTVKDYHQNEGLMVESPMSSTKSFDGRQNNK